MKMQVRSTLFGAVLWMGVQKIADLLSHHFKSITKLEQQHVMLFDAITLIIAIALIYYLCPDC
jgi:cell division protein FtsL